MNRQDKNVSCSMPSKTVRMSPLNGYLQNTSKKRTNHEGMPSLPSFVYTHCSITIYRLWRDVTSAIQKKDMEQATSSKSLVEDAQREQRRYMEERGTKHEPRFFALQYGKWTPKLRYVFSTNQKSDIFKYVRVPKDPQEATKAVQEWIFPSTSFPAE